MVATIVRAVSATLYALGCVVAVTGCYTYQMVPREAVTPGISVRATLTSPGMVRLEDLLGGPRRIVEGQVVETSSTEVTLLSRTQTAGLPENGFGSPFLRQRIIIQQQEIESVEQRILDRKKTTLFSIVVSAALGVVFVHFFTGGSRGRNPDQPEPGDELIRVP
ncbi:MAG: hypothetical protein HY701_05585 [Gemmatimonadetes bacterium]|nr:hypothetical protein [Gemmatimonadota bacterium]